LRGGALGCVAGDACHKRPQLGPVHGYTVGIERGGHGIRQGADRVRLEGDSAVSACPGVGGRHRGTRGAGRGGVRHLRLCQRLRAIGRRAERSGGIARRGCGCQGPQQYRAGLRLHGDGTGDGGSREAGVCQGQTQGVAVRDQAGINERHALRCREGGDPRCQVAVGRRHDHVEAQRSQVGLELRPGDRLTGEDCGRQTNSLLDC
jgi:hypothetical protein